ncbi:hypothetical protein LINGRAPRIM_LOCUS2031 [Linum grandiflorum]
MDRVLNNAQGCLAVTIHVDFIMASHVQLLENSFNPYRLLNAQSKGPVFSFSTASRHY